MKYNIRKILNIEQEYDNKKYWIKRGKTYYQNFKYNKDFINQEFALIEFMKKNNIPTDNILEVGCGFGRITNLVSTNFIFSRYTAIDISEHQLDKASELCSNKVNFTHTDIDSFDTNRYYDLVLAVEVLMHIKPERIFETIKKLLSMGKHLLHIDYYSLEDIPLANYNFNHCYNDIYYALGVEVITQRIGKQVIFYTNKSLYNNGDII